MSSSLSHPVVAAIYDPVTWVAERTILRPHREYLVQNLQGRVLDLGTGTGAMFPYVTDATSSDRTIEFHALEPDPHMRKRAANRAAELNLDVDLHAGRAETLPYADDSFDVVISSMVFCTIQDVEAAIEEVVRVLTPGGEFRFLEHVAADGWRHRLQTLVAPIWHRVAGGCHLTRRTPQKFVPQEALDLVEIQRMNVGFTPVQPFVRGRLSHRRSV